PPPPLGATLSGAVSVVPTNGVATFSTAANTGLSVNLSTSGYQLVASSGALTPVTTNTFNITQPSTPTQIVLSPPQFQNVVGGTLPANTPFTIVASLTDAFGNVTSSNALVTLTLSNNPGGITFNSIHQPASNGVATFSGLTITTAANGYAFSAST